MSQIKSIPTEPLKGLVPSTNKLIGSGMTFAIVHTRWNLKVVNELVEECTKTLKELGAKYAIHEVPGCYELPLASSVLGSNPDITGVISIGVLIKGSTMHFEYIADATSHGLMRVGLDLKKPVIFGVLTCLTEEQAWERAGFNGGHNHGQDWATAAIEMSTLLKKNSS